MLIIFLLPIYLLMKKIFSLGLFVFFIFLTSALFLTNECFSQYDSSENVFHLDKLSAEGTLLDKGWKFQPSDSPDYAKPEYDDSKWQAINPTSDIHDLPPITKSRICWLRLHLVIDSNLLKKQLALMITQVVASEIYLNGRLIYRFGTVSTNPKEIKAYNPGGMPLSFLFDKNARQILAVRYVVQPNLLYATKLRNPAVKIEVNETNTAIKQWRWFERGLPTSIIFRIGAFFILAFLYFAFFCYYPERRANLFFCLYALFLILSDVFQLNYSNPGFVVKYIFFLETLDQPFRDLANLFLLTALYSLLEQKRGWIYWTLIAAITAGIFLNVVGFSYRFEISQVWIGNLVNIEIVRTAFKALRLKTKGAWIISTGAISFLIFWGAFVFGVFIYDYISIPISENYKLADVLYNLSQLSIPVATAIYLALDFAFTSHALKQKLTEVEELSEKAIAQEKEKQQILSSVNETLEKQVGERTAELKKSLEELKSTQAQLIQSEKMASLGELTAGIAHEIQNPLNFVNNFSEVSNELLDEMKTELSSNNKEDAIIIADDVKQNLEKIIHHGKRADAIVKGMLQHSRVSTGQKEPTDINSLADEYLRLSYHGMKAKDKTFNAILKTDFDSTIGKINIVPQDIGRVLLNLFNNAFYAVSERRKVEGEEYEPGVSICTKKVDNKIEIHVKDNGIGIPPKAIDKIFQPFFTTKPTGQGTGLGLSLSYDIIKAHGGEIKVETKEGEGSEFVIQLPITA
jgi:two-component system NtrC family sensor kinase